MKGKFRVYYLERNRNKEYEFDLDDNEQIISATVDENDGIDLVVWVHES